jgi:hypothetical protein
MKNIEQVVEGSMLTIRIDLSKSYGPSASGKSVIIASTEGNQPIGVGMFLGLNVYKKT